MYNINDSLKKAKKQKDRFISAIIFKYYNKITEVEI